MEYAYTSLGGELSLQLVTDGIGSSAGFTGSFTKVYSGTNIRGGSGVHVWCMCLYLGVLLPSNDHNE